MAKLLICNSRIIDPKNEIDFVGDLLIKDGKIELIAEKIRVGEDHRKIDATNCLTTPGLIDMHVHLREPGFEHKETIASGTRAAAIGGFTSVACMANTNPTIDSPDLIEFVKSQAEKYGSANVFPIGSITKDLDGKIPTDWRGLISTGAIALSDDGKTVMNSAIMRDILQLSAELDFPVIDHCEDHNLTVGTVMNLGETSKKLDLPGQPNSAEEIIIARDLLLADGTGGHIHIAHVSTKRGVELIRWAKDRGIRVTAEACPHHFILTDSAIEKYGADAKMHPPLRTQIDVEAVIDGLADGTIDAIVTDHAPHAPFEKAKGMIESPAGVIGLETSFPLVHTFLIDRGKLSISDAIAKMTHIPAEILGIDRGTLSMGSIADVTIFDLNCEKKIDKTEFASKSRNTPFDGWELKGFPIMTIRSGKIKFTKGKI